MTDGAIARITTVTINAPPNINATRRMIFLSKGKLMSPEYEKSNSDVTSKIIAVIAIHKLISDKERGNCINLAFYYLVPYFDDFLIRRSLCFFNGYQFSGFHCQSAGDGTDYWTAKGVDGFYVSIPRVKVSVY